MRFISPLTLANSLQFIAIAKICSHIAVAFYKMFISTEIGEITGCYQRSAFSSFSNQS